MSLSFTSLIPKQKEGEKFPKILTIVFYVSIGTALLSLGLFFLLGNLEKKSENLLAEQEKLLLSQKTPEQLKLEKDILSFRQKIKDFNPLFGQHRLASNVFPILEDLTHSKVWFTNFQLFPRQSKVVTNGKAQSFRALAEQMLVFKESKDIKNVTLSGARLGTAGEIDFDLQISLDPGVFSFEASVNP